MDENEKANSMPPPASVNSKKKKVQKNKVEKGKLEKKKVANKKVKTKKTTQKKKKKPATSNDAILPPSNVEQIDNGQSDIAQLSTSIPLSPSPSKIPEIEEKKKTPSIESEDTLPPPSVKQVADGHSNIASFNSAGADLPPNGSNAASQYSVSNVKRVWAEVKLDEYVSDEARSDSEHSEYKIDSSDDSASEYEYDSSSPKKKTRLEKDTQLPSQNGDHPSASMPDSKRQRNKKIKQKRRPRKGSATYRNSCGGDFSDEEEWTTPTSHEKRSLMYELTSKRPEVFAKPVQVPPDSGMGEGELQLFVSLAERGYKPLMSGYWADDFETLPASLFTKIKKGKTEKEEGLVFNEKLGSEFDAIKALQELLTLGGRFRDCKLLQVRTERIINQAIRKYLRWAMKDCNLKISSEMIPVHIVSCQRKNEDTITIITRASKRLERLAKRHQAAHSDAQNPYWPILLGFILCGHIFSIVSIDSDPNGSRWTSSTSDTPIKYLSYFDLSDFDQDVWNSLAIAISINHVRDTMNQLANFYTGPLVPCFRIPGENEMDDEDV